MGGNMSLLKRLCDDDGPNTSSKTVVPKRTNRPSPTSLTSPTSPTSPTPSLGLPSPEVPRRSTDVRDSYLLLAFDDRPAKPDPQRLSLPSAPRHLGHCARRDVETSFVRPARLLNQHSVPHGEFVRQKTSHHKILKELLNSPSASCVTKTSTRSKVQSRLVRAQMPRITISPSKDGELYHTNKDFHAKATALRSQFDLVTQTGSKQSTNSGRGTLTAASQTGDPLAAKEFQDHVCGSDAKQSEALDFVDEHEPPRSASDGDDSAAVETQFTKEIRAAHRKLLAAQRTQSKTPDYRQQKANNVPVEEARSPANVMSLSTGFEAPNAATSRPLKPRNADFLSSEYSVSRGLVGLQLAGTEGEETESTCPVCGHQRGPRREVADVTLAWACSLCGHRRPPSARDKGVNVGTKYPSFVPFEGQDLDGKVKTKGQRKEHPGEEDVSERTKRPEGSPSKLLESSAQGQALAEELDRRVSVMNVIMNDSVSLPGKTKDQRVTLLDKTASDALKKQLDPKRLAPTPRRKQQLAGDEPVESPTHATRHDDVDGDKMIPVEQDSKPYEEARAMFERAESEVDRSRTPSRFTKRTAQRYYLRKPAVDEACFLKPASHFERRQSAKRCEDGKTLVDKFRRDKSSADKLRRDNVLARRRQACGSS